jgi:four helix bundle protein
MTQYRRTQNPEPRTSGGSVDRESGYSYRNLIIWDKAQNLTLEIVRLIARLPDDRISRIIGDQILRSSSSVGANIAEGHGRFSIPAHANYLSIAKASACETHNWLDLLRRIEYVTEQAESTLHADCTEIIRMLTAKILDLGRIQRAARTKPGRLGEEVAIYGAPDYDESNALDHLDPEVLGSPVPGSPAKKRGPKYKRGGR